MKEGSVPDKNNDKLRWAVSLCLTAALGLCGWTWAFSQSAQTERYVNLKEAAAVAVRQSGDNSLLLASVTTDLATIKDDIRNINDKLDRMK